MIVVYHGTDQIAAQNISARGFDPKRIGRSSGNYGALGWGVYFSDHESAGWYGRALVEAEIACEVHDWGDPVVREVCAAIGWPADYMAAWGRAKDRKAARSLARMLLARGVRAVRCQYRSRWELVVYDVDAITVRGHQIVD